MSTESEPREEPREAAHRPAGEGVVLVVEDDASLRLTMQWALEDEGIVVDLAPDGVEALDYVRRRRPALLLLDMGLPRLNGEAVAAGVRELHGDSVPIVVITADGHAQEKARRVGAIGYLKKPFEIDDLLEMVHRTLD